MTDLAIQEIARDRTPLEMLMFAAWMNVEPEQVPPEYKAHLNPVTMAAWKRVGEAARKHIEAEVVAWLRDMNASQWNAAVLGKEDMPWAWALADAIERGGYRQEEQ